MRVPFQLRDDGTIHSAMTIISKDVGIVMDDARLQTFPAPMCSVAEQLFVGALGAGLARDDDVNIVKMYDYFGVPPSLETGTEEEEIERAKELTVTPSHPPKKVLFVGLGAMGAPMAAVLSVSGLQVAGYDVSLEAMDRFAKVGGRVVGDPAVEAKDSDAVVICTVTALQAEAFLASVAPGECQRRRNPIQSHVSQPYLLAPPSFFARPSPRPMPSACKHCWISTAKVCLWSTRLWLEVPLEQRLEISPSWHLEHRKLCLRQVQSYSSWRRTNYTIYVSQLVMAFKLTM